MSITVGLWVIVYSCVTSVKMKDSEHVMARCMYNNIIELFREKFDKWEEVDLCAFLIPSTAWCQRI